MVTTRDLLTADPWADVKVAMMVDWLVAVRAGLWAAWWACVKADCSAALTEHDWAMMSVGSKVEQMAVQRVVWKAEQMVHVTAAQWGQQTAVTMASATAVLKAEKMVALKAVLLVASMVGHSVARTAAWTVQRSAVE